jgi:hypothetical protein
MRSTSIRLMLDYCPRAVDHYDAGEPSDTAGFQYGVAAHAVLQALIEHPDDDPAARAEAVVRELVTNGRSFYEHREPPMHPEAACAGRDVALDWLARDLDGLCEGWRAEVMLSVDRDWQPCDYDRAWLHAVIDVVGPAEYDDGETQASGVLVRDWKGSYQTEEADLGSLQQRIQALLVAAHHPGAAFLRRQVVSLRTAQTFSEDLWLDEAGQATLARWRRDIEHVAAQYHARDEAGRRPARPGACCGGCPYVLRCEEARDAIPLFWAGAPDVEFADPAVLAEHYAAMRAMSDAMAAILRRATSEVPIPVPGGSVGFTTRTTREAAPDGARALAAAWFNPADPAAWERDHADVLGLLQVLRPGASGIEAVGKILYPGKGASKMADFRERREALESATLTEKTGATFGVTRR